MIAIIAAIALPNLLAAGSPATSRRDRDLKNIVSAQAVTKTDRRDRPGPGRQRRVRLVRRMGGIVNVRDSSGPNSGRSSIRPRSRSRSPS
jgi:hypothetical protein